MAPPSTTPPPFPGTRTRGTIARQPGLRVSLLEQHRDFGDAVTVWEAAAGELAELLALEQSLADQAVALAHDSSEEAMNRYGRDLERFESERESKVRKIRESA